jgi:hypothetical protein
MKRATSVWIRLKRFICCRVHSCFGIWMLSTICRVRCKGGQVWNSEWVIDFRPSGCHMLSFVVTENKTWITVFFLLWCACAGVRTAWQYLYAELQGAIRWACVQDNTCSFLDGIYFIIYHNIDPWWDFLQWQYVVMFVRTYFDGLFKCYMIIVFSRIVLFWT